MGNASLLQLNGYVVHIYCKYEICEPASKQEN